MLRFFFACFFFACFFFSLFIINSHATEGAYKVIYVYDGDTVKLRPTDSNGPRNEFKLRLIDIDAPERNQDFGLKSRRALIKLCQGKNIMATVQITGKDKYLRSLGKLQCNGVDAAYYQAEHGYAWHYTQYSSNAAIFKAAKNARKLSLGLWENSNPTPPWVWRHSHIR